MTYDRPGSQYDPSRDQYGASQQEPIRSSSSTSTGSVQTQERSYQGPPRQSTYKSKSRHFLFAVLGAAVVAGVLGGLIASHARGPSVAAVSHPAVHASTHPSAHVIGTFTGTGGSTSPAFKVTSSPVYARYGYSCAAAGKTTGKFAATMAMKSGINGQTIANTSGSAGTAAVALHPSHIGSMYHVSVTATCPWRVIVYSH
jgi:hypothetical protein